MGAGMIKASGVNHIALKISEVARSRNFYEGLLGLTIVPFPEMDREQAMNFRNRVVTKYGVSAPTGGIWLAAGATQLHLIVTPGKREGVINPFGPHVAFDVENFGETRRALQEKGIEFLEAPSGRQLWILDPDGNTVELRTE